MKTGVRQECILAPDAFNVAMDRILGRTVSGTHLGSSKGVAACSDFDFADDVALLAEVYDTLTSALSFFEEEASELGLHTNWLKTKVQSLSDFLPRPPNLTVQGETVEVVEKFQYLGMLIHESCSSSLEIRRRIELARSAFGGLEEGIWKSRIALRTKVRLYSTYVVPVLLYGSETWAPTKSEERRINAFGWKCLRHICGVRWSDFIPNVEIQRRTGALPLSTIIQRRRLSLFGHIIRMPKGSDVRSLLVARVPVEWKRPRGRPRTSWMRIVQADLDTVDVSLEEAITMSVERIMWWDKINEIALRATLPKQE